ncbi:MAG: GTPase [Candidatus Aminicenantia bacterium]
MPANLPPEYFEVEKKLGEAKTLQEKIKVYEALLSVIPKHKGTEKSIGDIRAKISKLKQELERKPSSKQTSKFIFKKTGAGQVAIIGPSNSEKSSLISALTNAKPEISNYPFTTKGPSVGMMPYENIQIQLVNSPPITDVFYESHMHESVKHADLTVVLLDLQSPMVLEELEAVLEKLDGKRFYLASPSGIHYLDQNFPFYKAILFGNKYENETANENLKILKEFYYKRFEFIPLSVKYGFNLETLKRKVSELLKIIRVYTKEPGENQIFLHLSL